MLLNVDDYLTELSPLFSGRLLLKREIRLDEQLFQTLLQNNLFKEIRSIKKYIGFYECQRCFNQSSHYFGRLPDRTVYCKKCIMMGRVSEKEPLYEWCGPDAILDKVSQACEWNGVLSPLQKHASLKIVEAIQNRSQILIHAVCGSGKTEMLYEGIAHAIEAGKKVCIATPRTDVVRELAPRFRRDFPNIKSCALYMNSTEKDVNAHLVIATTHQLLRYKDAFDVTVIDEVDAFPFHNDPTLKKAVKRATKKDGSTIYLTATPRLDMKLKKSFQLIPAVSIPLRFHGHPLPVPKFHYIHQLEKQLKEEKIPADITDWFKNRKRRYLIFVPTIEMAEQVSVMLDHTPFVHAESPDRAELIQQFRNKKMNRLITTTILERGVTFPSIDVAIIQADHHVFDEAALIQIAGRAGRSHADPTGDVVFFYETKTRAMVSAKKEIVLKNDEGKKWKEETGEIEKI